MRSPVLTRTVSVDEESLQHRGCGQSFGRQWGQRSQTGAWKHTAFGSHFDTFYSDRYLTTSRVKAINDALAGIPYEHIIILANTEQYGGGGIYNAFTLTTAHHPNFRPVVYMSSVIVLVAWPTNIFMMKTS